MRIIGWARMAALAAFSLALVGCSRQALLEKITTPEDRGLGQKLVQAIQSADDAWISQQASPDIQAKLTPLLPSMRQELPAGPARLVNAQSTTMTSTSEGTTQRTLLDYEVDKGDRHDVVEIVIDRKGGRASVAGLHVTRVANPLDKTPPFELSGRPAWAYGFLALVIAAPLVSLWGLLAVLRTRRLRLKWLWAIGCLIGIVSFDLNWTTGQFDLEPFRVQLLSASFLSSGGDSGWTIGFAIPIVAILFLATHFRRREPQPAKAF